MSGKSNITVSTFGWKDFLFGLAVGVLLTLLCMIGCKANFSGVSSGNKDIASTVSTETEEETETEAVKDYNTTAKDFNVELASGEKVMLHTPEGFYNLTEMYSDDFGNYYGVDMSKYGELMIHVGDSDTTYDSKTVINAAHLEGIKEMMKDMAGDNYNDSLVYSEVYDYMKTGKQPADTETVKNMEITDLEVFEHDGIKYSCYKLGFDNVVESDEEATAEEPEEELSHQESIYCYTDTEDPIEFVIYQEVVNSEKAVALLKEMVGAE